MAEYRITERDYVEASYYALRTSRRILFLAMMLIPLMIPLGGGFTRNSLILLGFVWAGVILLLIFAEPEIFRMLLRRKYRQNPIYHKSQFVTISEGEITLQSEKSYSTYQIPDLEKIEYHDGLFLLYPASTYYHIVPEEALDDSEIELLSGYCT